VITTLQIIGLIALGVVVIALMIILVLKLIYLVTKLVYQSMEGPLEDRIAVHYDPDEIVLKDLKANSFGLESAGVWQVRGNGGLVLTAQCLHFFLFLPERDLRVPLDAITELTFTRSHLSKMTIHDLLKVAFSVEGKLDSIAWYLTDP
jgi:hypothetical protein